MKDVRDVQTSSAAQRGEQAQGLRRVGTGVRPLVVTARKLRANLTDVERKLWHRIREKQIEGVRFRRQRPIGKYIVDFVCLESKLIVELDGGQHADAIPADAARTAFLESLGYRVLRFWNNEVLENMVGVLERIRQSLLQPAKSNPTPTLPFAGEGADRDNAGVGTAFPSPTQRGKLAKPNPTPTLPFAGEGADRDNTGVGTESPSPAQRGKAGMGVRSYGGASNKKTKALEQ